jgi:hypothetical protein
VAVNQTTIRKVQAIATIGAGVVALHGITSHRWKRGHTFFVGLGLAASVARFVVPKQKAPKPA